MDPIPTNDSTPPSPAPQDHPRSTLVVEVEGDATPAVTSDSPEVTPPAAVEAPAEGTADAPPETNPADAQAAEVVAAAGLDMAALSAEFAERGELSPESFKALEAVGISRQLVDSYIAGVRAVGDKQRQDLAASVGGEDTLQAIMDWGRFNLSPQEQAAWDATARTGNHEAIKTAAAGLKARWVAAGQDEPTGTILGHRGTSAADSYASKDEMLSDISRPLYRESQAERNRVMEKLKRSKV